MAEAIRPLIAGNWKMNGLTAALAEVEKLGALLAGQAVAGDVAICPPATLLMAMSAKAGGLGIATGGQDCHAEASGAHTGDISAEMLKDAGAAYVIVGHSERRADHGETDATVRAKAEAAIRAGLTPIICVGETRAERLKMVSNSSRPRWPTSSRPEAVQLRGLREPTREVTWNWPPPSSMARTTIVSWSRPQTCTVSPEAWASSCISCWAAVRRSRLRA